MLYHNLKSLQYFETGKKFSQLVVSLIKLKASFPFITLLNVGKSYHKYNTERPIQKQHKNQHRASFTKFSLAQPSRGFSQSKAMPLVVLDTVASNRKKIWLVY